MGWTTPTDRSTGYVVTAADWNIVEDNLAYLYGDTAWTAVSAFTNSWVAFGAGAFAPGYRLVGNRVTLRGCMKSGTVNAAAFTLPAAYRPTNTAKFSVDSNGAFGVVSVTSAGVVTCEVGNNASVFLDGITFDTLT